MPVRVCCHSGSGLSSQAVIAWEDKLVSREYSPRAVARRRCGLVGGASSAKTPFARMIAALVVHRRVPCVDADASTHDRAPAPGIQTAVAKRPGLVTLVRMMAFMLAALVHPPTLRAPQAEHRVGRYLTTQPGGRCDHLDVQEGCRRAQDYCQIWSRLTAPALHEETQLTAISHWRQLLGGKAPEPLHSWLQRVRHAGGPNPRQPPIQPPC
mmetsp:Transcript_9893/g.36226  ORF Transcript_9893/g.36226 Transcript_9893/m.36226 type:complete len:211 (-) Transcript_9893:4264-4896(-)